MARPKEFQREQALEQAMNVFWTHGYEATSMTDLQKAMGIGRQSLYDTFGDKRQLFEDALAMYLAGADARNTRVLGANNGMQAIRSFFDSTVRGLTQQSPRRACLMFNTCVELAPHNKAVNKQLKKALKGMQSAFEGALLRAQDQGDLCRQAKPRELAVFLTTQLGGISVLAKTGSSHKDLKAAADLALGILR